MGSGVIFAFLTGLIWSAAGIIISRCAEEKFSLGLYSFLQTLFAGILALVCFGRIAKCVWTEGFIWLSVTVFAAGMLNAGAQFLVRLAMKNGNHAPIWSMMQCCLLFPFLAGILIFGERAALWPVCGMLLMIGGILLPGLKGFQNVKAYFGYSMAALLLFGLAQVLYLACSCIRMLSDPAALRPALVCFGNMAAWSILIRLEPEKSRLTRRLLLLAVAMAVVHAVGLNFFFKALDLLSRAGKGSIAIPLIMGTNISAFALYSRFILKQKNAASDIGSILVVLAGLFCFALDGR